MITAPPYTRPHQLLFINLNDPVLTDIYTITGWPNFRKYEKVKNKYKINLNSFKQTFHQGKYKNQ